MKRKKQNVLKHLRTIGYLTLIMGVLSGCGKQEDQDTVKTHIDPPFPGLDPEYQSFTINQEKKDTLKLSSGTEIRIPANAFKDSAGNPVNGEIEFYYREFHEALDIFLAGVPMHIDVGGSRRQLQTAGMFEMRAEKDGTRLELKNNKKIEVKFGSRVAGTDYNRFVFNDSTGNWQFSGYSESRVNPEYAETREKIESLRQTRKYPLKDEYFIFNYAGALDVYYNMYKQDDYSYDDNPAIRERIKGYGGQWIDVDNKKRIRYKGRRMVASFMLWKRISGGPFPDWVKEGDYSHKNTEKIRNDLYLFGIENDEGETYSARIKCVMPLRSLLSFKPEYWENHYEEAMEKVKKEQKRLQTEARVYRTFKASSLGFSNFDRLLKLKDPLKVKACFTVDSSYRSKTYNLKRVFCLPGDNRSVVQFKVKDTNRVMLDAADSNYRFTTVLPGNRLGMFPMDQYRNLNFDSLKRVKDPVVHIEFEPKGTRIESRKGLKELLDI